MAQFDAFYVFRAGGARIAVNDMNVCHSIDKNEARVYLKKEEATARADFSSVQGGKSKV